MTCQPILLNLIIKFEPHVRYGDQTNRHMYFAKLFLKILIQSLFLTSYLLNPIAPARRHPITHSLGQRKTYKRESLGWNDSCYKPAAFQNPLSFRVQISFCGFLQTLFEQRNYNNPAHIKAEEKKLVGVERVPKILLYFKTKWQGC